MKMLCTTNTASASKNELHAVPLIARAAIYFGTGSRHFAFRKVPRLACILRIKADVANTRELATHELSRVALHTARLLPGTALIASRSCALVSLC